MVRGRLILIPALNLPAAKAATRLSPLDGKNLNRSFPGRADGTVTEMIAHYLTTVLFPLADIVIDIHTGGRSVDFYPCAHMHLVPDRAQRQQMIEGTLAWNSDFAFLYTDIAGTGLLPVEAESQGKIVITTEMGGGEPIPASVHRLTQEGLRNVLVHFGILRGEKTDAGRPRPAADPLGPVARPRGLPLRPRERASTRTWSTSAPRCPPASPWARSTSWNVPTASRSRWSRRRGHPDRHPSPRPGRPGRLRRLHRPRRRSVAAGLNAQIPVR